MKPELEDRLVQEYAEIFSDWGTHPQHSAMAWGIECPSAWEGVSANAVLVSTVRLPTAFMHSSHPWETMAFPAFFRNGEMQVDYGELVCHRAATREEAWQNHDRVVREFSEGPSDRDPATGIQYGDLN